MRELVANVIGSAGRFIVKVIIWDFVFFQLGRVVLLTVTFGQYPTRKDCEHARDRIQWAGVATLVIAWAAVAVLNNLRS